MLLHYLDYFQSILQYAYTTSFQFFSIMIASNNFNHIELVSKACLIDGYIAIFNQGSSLAFYMCISHCVLRLDSEFLSKRPLHVIKYFIFALGSGTYFCLVGHFTNGVGLGILGACSTAIGSFLEYCLMQ